MTGQSLASPDELEELAATVRAYCRDRLPQRTLARPGDVRDQAAARDHWRKMASDLGIGALLVPEECEGTGASLVEAGRVAEALAAELATVPFLSAGVLAPTLLASISGAEPDSPAAALLAQLARGELIAVVAWADDDPGQATAAGLIGGGGSATASGRFGYVIDADLADVVILVGGSGTEVVAAQASDLEISPLASFDLTRGLATVTARDAPVTRLASGGAGQEAFARMIHVGRLVLASEAAGGAQAALAEAVGYARQRVQFGREIGSFQAIKHILADCYVSAESALSVARLAIAADQEATGDAESLAALASFFCAARFVEVATANIQVHGGIGFTVECDAHLFRRRAEADRQLLGAPSTFRAKFLDLVIEKENVA